MFGNIHDTWDQSLSFVERWSSFEGYLVQLRVVLLDCPLLRGWSSLRVSFICSSTKNQNFGEGINIIFISSEAVSGCVCIGVPGLHPFP